MSTEPLSLGGRSGGGAAAPQVQAIDPRARRFAVVDTDFHFHADFQTLRRYMAEPFRSKLTSYPPVGSEYSPVYAIGLEGTGQAVQGIARTAADVLRVIDEIAVQSVVLSPGMQRPQGIYNETIISALASAYNDYLIQEVLPASDRIRALIMINQKDPQEAAREIRRVGAHRGFVGVFSEFGGHVEPIGTARFDPMYEAMAEFDLPLSVHVNGFWPHDTPLAQGTRTWAELLGVAPMGVAMAWMGSMIFQGLFDAFPRQRVLMQEGGLWWIPEFMLRMDEMYLDHPGDIQLVARKLRLGEAYLRQLPSEYVLENFRFSTQPMCRPKDARDFQDLLRLCHADRMFLYSSDWPHQTFDPVNWVVESQVIPEEVQQRILSTNAREFFTRL